MPADAELAAMSNDGTGDDHHLTTDAEWYRQQVAGDVGARAAAPKPVTRYEVETARFEYFDELDRLRKHNHDERWKLSDGDKLKLDVLKLRYEAFQERFSEQRRQDEAADIAKLAASNTDLAKRQTNYARIVMCAVIVQAAGAAVAIWQAFYPKPASVLPPAEVHRVVPSLTVSVVPPSPVAITSPSKPTPPPAVSK
jgi:hypothetical protein